MKLDSFIKRIIINEGWKHNDKSGIHIYEPPLVKKGGQHPELPNALNHNGKNMFYSFDLTNTCDRGCPGCYVARGVEISLNGVSKIPLKEYKGDLQKWEQWAASNPENKKMLDDSKKQINANGGIRMFSAADYPDSSNSFYKQILDHYHITDPDYFKNQVKAFLDDAHETGWHVKAITKEKKFLKDHIDHPALKGVDVSMNAQGFGESHESVKNMRKGKHEDFDPKTNKLLKANKHKIIGRTVTHTPFDLLTILDHKKDHEHIGVITSGHDIPGSGIRYISSTPKDPFSPKTIIIQKNFPKKLMSILDGSLSLDQLSESEENLRHTIKLTLVKQSDGKWHEETSKSKTGQIDTKQGNVVANLEGDFEKRNPNFTHTFSNEDASFLLSKMQGKMCCAGEKEGEAKYGKCHNCNAKCGVEGATKTGEKSPNLLTIHNVARLLNQYSKDYNDTVNRVRKELQSGRIVVNEIKDSKGHIPDIRSNPTDNVDSSDEPSNESKRNKFIGILESLCERRDFKTDHETGDDEIEIKTGKWKGFYDVRMALWDDGGEGYLEYNYVAKYNDDTEEYNELKPIPKDLKTELDHVVPYDHWFGELSREYFDKQYQDHKDDEDARGDAEYHARKDDGYYNENKHNLKENKMSTFIDILEQLNGRNKIISRSEALRQDTNGEFYMDKIDDDYGVFGSESGFCYKVCSTRGEAREVVSQMNSGNIKEK